MPAAKPDLITFTRSDYSFPADLIEITKEFAEHFKRPRSYLKPFCRLIQTSKKWGIQSVAHNVEIWAAKFGMVAGRGPIIEMVRRAFGLCTTQDNIHELRGLMVESLIIASHGGTAVLNDPRFGWGAKVFVNNAQAGPNLIKYRCPTRTADKTCYDRSSVDFGFWNGYHGKFYECKAHPNSIFCKEIQYMRNLKSVLSNDDISHEVFFVCAEHKDSIVQRLEQYGCSPVYKAIGTDELEIMMRSA